MNPNDVFPRRNLPSEAEEWGREIEDRIRNVEYAAQGQKQGLNGANRNSASTTQELSRQLVQLRQVADDLQNLYNAIPKVTQDVRTATGFGVGAGWQTLVQSSITVPEGATTCSLLAVASGQLESNTSTGLITSRSIVIIDGSNGPVVDNPWYPGQTGFRSIMVPSYSRTFSVTPGTQVGTFFQANVDDPSSYPPNANSLASLSVIATFST